MLQSSAGLVQGEIKLLNTQELLLVPCRSVLGASFFVYVCSAVDPIASNHVAGMLCCPPAHACCLTSRRFLSMA